MRMGTDLDIVKPWVAIAVLFLVDLIGRADGQGAMLDPPGRGSLWRLGLDTPVNENDKLLNCGGVKHRWTKNEGKCGVCGDPWDANPRDHEAGGKYATQIITDVFPSGTFIDVVVDVAIDNGGYFEFRLCPHNDVMTPVSQACLDKGLLKIHGTNATKFTDVTSGLNRIRVDLPKDVVCEQCVLQWRHRTADHFGCDIDTITGNQTCGFGQGDIQSEYFACSDIAIYTDSKLREIRNTSSTFQTFRVPEVPHPLHRNRRAIFKGERTLIYPNGRIEIRGFRTPMSGLPPYVTIMDNSNMMPPQGMSNMQQRNVGSINPGMTWPWDIASGMPRNTVGRMRRRVHSNFNRRGNIRGRVFESGRSEQSSPTAYPGNFDLNTGEMFPGGGQQATISVRMERPEASPFFGEEMVAMSVPGPVVRHTDTTRIESTFVDPLNPDVSLRKLNKQVVTEHLIPTRQCQACPFDQCLDEYLNYENIFPGLFDNPTTFLQCKKYEKLFTVGKYNLLSEGLPECVHPRFRRQLSPRLEDDDIGCCGTRAQVILPLTVESDNETYNVVQLPNDRNQFLVQGICGRNGTRSCSVCSSEDNFQWVLVYDTKVRTRPPVSFVPVKFPHYCRCMNPGGRAFRTG